MGLLLKTVFGYVGYFDGSCRHNYGNLAVGAFNEFGYFVEAYY